MCIKGIYTIAIKTLPLIAAVTLIASCIRAPEIHAMAGTEEDLAQQPYQTASLHGEGAKSGPDATLSIEPIINKVEVGELFKLDVRISTERVSRGAQFALSFDPDVLRFESVEEGSFYKDWAESNGGITFVIPWAHKERASQTSTGGIAILGGPREEGSTGSGVLATISLRGLADGYSHLRLNNVVVVGLDETATHIEMPISTNNNDIHVTVGKPGPLWRIQAQVAPYKHLVVMAALGLLVLMFTTGMVVHRRRQD